VHILADVLSLRLFGIIASMKLLSEFKKFAVKGNAVDMAVGIIIGAAFGTVVKSLVDDVIMPPIGKFLGGADFSSLFINISGETYESLAAAQEAGAATINYGLFINAIISFLIVGWVLFFVVKATNRLKKEEPEIPSRTKTCPACKSSIHIDATRCPQCTSEF
jgi:large conductance mechanosensitive channel